jgi:hypothetical protein
MGSQPLLIMVFPHDIGAAPLVLSCEGFGGNGGLGRMKKGVALRRLVGNLATV